MTGILVLNKEPGMTSFDVVAIVRKGLHIKKVGHTGTLDPDATGVLPVCVGRATRVCDLLIEADKRYRAVVQLGARTDTGDAGGNVTETSTRRVCEAEVLSALPNFTGKLLQTPPMYSAIKVGGRKLYELARKGITVEREQRPVEIYSLVALDFDEDAQSLVLDVHCSKGTYVRTLCDDLGCALGTYAHLKQLTRTKSGPFTLDDAMRIDEFRKLAEAGEAEQHLIPVDSVFQALPAIFVDGGQERRIRNGNSIRCGGADLGGCSDGKYRIYNARREFLAIYECVGRPDASGIVELRCAKSFFEV